MGLTRKDLALFPTQHGFLFLGILIAMLLGSINYNNNAGFILVFLLGSMALISLFFSYKNLLGTRIIPGHPLAVFAGKTAFFPVLIQAPENRGQALELFFEQRDEDRISAEKNGEARIDVPFDTKTRGYHLPGLLTLESVFPLGLFRLRTKIAVHTGVLVYPEPISGPLPAGAAGGPDDGEEKSRFMGPDDFQGLSPYVPGSPVGHISWKTLSKGKGLFVKNFIAETGQELLFDLDRVKGEDLETRLSRLCGAILDARQQHRPYGLRLGQGQGIVPGSGSAHLHLCLQALALFGKPVPGSGQEGA